jgi:hypothetical protein
VLATLAPLRDGDGGALAVQTLAVFLGGAGPTPGSGLRGGWIFLR